MSLEIPSVKSQFNIKDNKPRIDSVYEFADFRLDAAKLMLYANGKAVDLAPKVVETLLALVERGGEIVSKDELMKRLWKDSFVEEGNLTQYIYLLRKTLGDSQEGVPMIETFRRRGYRFNGQLTTRPEPAERQEPSNATPPIEKNRRLSPGLAVGLLGLLGLVVLAGAVWFFYPRPQRPDDDPPAALPFQGATLTRLTRESNIFYPAISPDGKHLAYTTIETDGTTLWLKDMVSGESRLFLPKVKKAYRAIQFSRDGSHLYFLRENNSLASIPVSGGDAVQVLANVPNPFAVSPDDARVVFLRGTDLILARTDNGEERVLASGSDADKWITASTSAPSWAPDGASIVVSTSYTELGRKRAAVSRINIADGTEKLVNTPDWAQITDAAWTSDGKSILVIARETAASPFQIWQVTLADDSARRITKDLHSYEGLSLSADSALLVTSQKVGGANIWIGTLDGKNDFKQITFYESEIAGRAGIAFLPDGDLVFSSPSSGNIDIWTMDQNGGGSRQLTSNSGDWNGRQVVTPDGRYIVFASTRSGPRSIWRMRQDGSEPVQLTTGSGEDYPEVSPDGKYVYYNRADDERAAIWRVSIDGQNPERISGDHQATNASVSPDGKLMAFVHAENGQTAKWETCVVTLEKRDDLKCFGFVPFRNIIRWRGDSTSLLFIAENSPNIWEQKLSGGPPTQVTTLSLEETWNFAYSPKANRVALSRGSTRTEAVSITNFR